MRRIQRTVMQPWRNERGVVLPLALMALLVLGTVSAALLAVGNSEVQIAANHRGAVQAHFLAEAGLERAFDWLRTNPAQIGNAGIPFQNVALGGMGSYTVQVQPAGADTALVVSTGTTTIGSAQKALSATMTTRFILGDAILSGRIKKEIWSHSRVEGACGNVHANGDLTVTSQASVAGRATASGTFEKLATAEIGGVYGGGFPQKTIPEIRPSEFLAVAKRLLPANQIYQLMADGRVLDGNDAVMETVRSERSSRLVGWRYELRRRTPTWIKLIHPFVNGTYYVEGDANLHGSPGTDDSPWRLTVIATGDIDVTGQPNLANHLADIVFVSGRDIKIRGTTDYTLKSGLIAAHGTVHFNNSNATLYGSILEEGLDSTREVTEFGAQIRYDCGLNLPGPAGWLQILAWGF